MPSLASLLNPAGIALIGASPDDATIRGRIVRGVQHLPYTGQVVAVSRTHKDIAGLPTVASVEELPRGLELAVITVPAIHVAAALDAAGKKGIRAAVVISSGFAEERGDSGVARQKELVAIADSHDMLLCGPNAEGFLNAKAPLAATFSPAAFELADGDIYRATPGGAVAVVSQSGGIGFSFLNRGVPAGIPFSYVISTGNEAQLDSLTVVDYLLDDRNTGIVLMFLEGIRKPELLDAVLRKARSAGKTIVVAKMGRSTAGASAAASHTASLAGSYRACAAKMEQGCAIMAEDQDHALALIQALSYFGARLPDGNRVGILTPSGGAGIWLADVATTNALEVPELDSKARAAFDELLPQYGASRNPVDVTAQFIFNHGYAKALEIMAASPEIDAIAVASSMIHSQTITKDADNLRRVAATLEKPVVFCAYTLAHPDAVSALSDAGFPVYTSMVSATRALAAMAEHRRQRERHERSDSRSENATAPLVRTPVAAPVGRWLTEFETRDWLGRFGLETGEATLATSADEAVVAARKCGTPVAMKIQAEHIQHKSDVGGVLLNVSGDASVAHGFARLMEAAKQVDANLAPQGVLITKMAMEGGVDLIAGLHPDPSLGPMLLVGSGGMWVELLDDARLVALPAGRQAIEHELRQLRCWPVLDGFRGKPASDIAALLDALEVLCAFALAHESSLAELEINPIRVHTAGSGVSILDALSRTTDTLT
ncbi:MAG: acyl-CoA synthetase (NDP forming) [Rhodothermales bacterium]|jgi:acyl-CoA synthetase (NDP forming)